MEQLLNESRDQLLEKGFCKKLARDFNRSSGRAKKPVVKWTEIQSWFHMNRPQVLESEDSSGATNDSALCQIKATESPKMLTSGDSDDLSGLEFEARSAKDGAWYDVDTFLSHRFLSSGETEFCVRYVGYGAEEDEWVNVKDSLRERSVPLEHSECHNLEVGDLVVCFQESQDQVKYYDAHVVEIQRRWHDIRGCRCLFLIRYTHDNFEEKVRLRRLCCRPNALSKVE